MDIIPFHSALAYGGFAEVYGLVRIDGDDLVVEHQVKDGLFGVVKSDIRETRLPCSELESVTVKRGIFSPCLIISVRRLGLLSDFPGDHSTELRLKFSRKHREPLQHLATFVMMKIANHQVSRLDS